METIFATKVNDDLWHCGRHRDHLLSTVETGVSISTGCVCPAPSFLVSEAKDGERQCLVKLGCRGPLAKPARARASTRPAPLTTFLNLSSTRTPPVETCPNASVPRSPTSLKGGWKWENGEARQIQRVTDRGHALQAHSRAVDSHCVGAAYAASAGRRDAHTNGY